MRVLFAALALTVLAYWPGLYGDWLADDAPNILTNEAVQPKQLDVDSLVAAATSSPASSLKRPLASLSFAANFAIGGLDPFGWKLFNLIVHLANGWLVFLLARTVLRLAPRRESVASVELDAALIAAAWLLLPINLTGILYVVQRMESLANLFVLAGMLGYLHGRERMRARGEGFALCVGSLVGGVMLGLTAKETAILLPLYAALADYVLFQFRTEDGGADRRILLLFALVLVAPGLIGAALLVPWLTEPGTWAHRDFTLATRLLSEARIVVSYLDWTVLPLPSSLSFHHDNFAASSGLLAPWTTITSIATIVALLGLAWHLRRRQAVAALGIGLFFSSHLLTATVLPLELIFEHRNYFASFGVMLVLVPLLTSAGLPQLRARQALLALLLLWWSGLTAQTAYAWGNGLRLAQELAQRAPDSARAQVALGAELVWRSGPDYASPLLTQGYAVLERASLMPSVSIRPEQVMIYTDAILQRETQAAHWNRLIAKLGRRAPSAEDVSALTALTLCARAHKCKLPNESMQAAFEAAERHGRGDARLLIIHSDFAWNLLGDRALAQQLTEAAIQLRPRDSDARISLARMHLVLGRPDQARLQLQALQGLNHAGQLDQPIAELSRLIESRTPKLQ